MKTCAFFILLLFALTITLPAKIRNGYSIHIESARASLKRIQLLLQEDPPLLERTSMKMKVTELTDFITYCELTEKMLGQFRMISPDLYLEIDTLKDLKGRSIDVYVKFLSEKKMTPGIEGTTNLGQDKNDPDAYVSEYGRHTVSVKIVIGKNALHILAHELGHVRYQAPNLAAYMQFYTKFYLANTGDAKSIGHNDNDASGKHARSFSRRFRENYLAFPRSDDRKLESYSALLQEIKRRLNDGAEI